MQRRACKSCSKQTAKGAARAPQGRSALLPTAGGCGGAGKHATTVKSVTRPGGGGTAVRHTGWTNGAQIKEGAGEWAQEMGTSPAAVRGWEALYKDGGHCSWSLRHYESCVAPTLRHTERHLLVDDARR